MKQPFLYLVVGVLAGTALAQSSGGQSTATEAAPPAGQYQPPNAKLVKQAQGASTCEEQCGLIAEPCKEPCGKLKNPAAKQICRDRCSEVQQACYGSCREKGRIDAKYIQKLLMPEGAGKHDD